MAEAEERASGAEAELAELRESAASSGSSIEQWRDAYADLQQHYSTLQVRIKSLGCFFARGFCYVCLTALASFFFSASRLAAVFQSCCPLSCKPAPTRSQEPATVCCALCCVAQALCLLGREDCRTIARQPRGGVDCNGQLSVD